MNEVAESSAPLWTSSKIFYLVLCLIVPPIWGVISYWLFSAFGSKLKKRAARRASGDNSSCDEVTGSK